MSQVQRAVLIAIMLIMLLSFVALFAGLSTPTQAALSTPAQGTPPSGEFCGGDTGFPCSTSTSQSPAPTPQPVKGYQTGKLDGRAAGENDPPGTNRRCPGQEGSEYCNGWYAGYNAAQQAKAKAQGSGISLMGISIPTPILIAIGVVVVILGGGIALGTTGAGAAVLARFRR